MHILAPAVENPPLRGVRGGCYTPNNNPLAPFKGGIRGFQRAM